MQWCEKCQIEFIPARSDQRFCSIACKQAAYRRRRAETLEQRDSPFIESYSWKRADTSLPERPASEVSIERSQSSISRVNKVQQKPRMSGESKQPVAAQPNPASIGVIILGLGLLVLAIATWIFFWRQEPETSSGEKPPLSPEEEAFLKFKREHDL